MKKLVIVGIILMFLLSWTAPGRVTYGNSIAQKGSSPIWPMFRYNAQHTGQCPYSTSNNNGNLKWRYNTEDSIYSSPAISLDGTIYVVSGGNLYAFSSEGTLKWGEYKIGNTELIGNWVQSSPAISPDGTIYVGSDDHYLYAFNPDGTLKWRYQTGSSICSSPAIASDGIIYVLSEDQHLYAINPSGVLRWKYETGSWIGEGRALDSSPVISADGTIYVGGKDDLYAINPNGTLKWKYETGNEIFSSPTISSNGIVYIASTDNCLYAIGGTGTFNSDIWVDKGCGATYSDNESIEVYFKSDKSGSAYILDYETDGNTEKFGPWNISAGKTYNLSGTVSGPDGTETLELHVKAPDGSLSVSSCEFYIENTAPSEVNVKLWLDKGCGATYCVGDAPRAYFEVDQDVPISMFEYMPDGTMKTIIDHQKCEANVEYYVDGKASYPLGKRTLKIEAYCPNDMETVIGSATCSFTVKDCKAKLNLTKVVDKSSAKVNDTLTYTITYSNDGNSNATGIKVTDAIPYGTKYISGSAEFIDIPSSSHSILFSHNDGGSYDNSDSLPVTNVKWTTSSLSPGTSIRVRFKVKIVKDSDFTIKNTANLIADSLDSPITASSTTEVYKTKPPSAPTLTAMPGDSKVTLTWTTPSQGTFPIAGYKIYRGSCSGGESNNPIATVNYGENKNVDQRVVNGKTYYYYIKAFDNQSPPNYSDPSNEVMAVPQSLTPPPDTTNTKDLDGDGKKDLSAGTTNNWVEVKTAHTSSVISSAGVQSDKKEVIKDVSTNKKLAGLKLISTSSPRILKNDSDYLIYEVDKFYEGYSGKSAIIRWTTIIPKNDDYWIFFAQMENTGYSPIDLSNNPNLLKTEIVSPERFIVSGVSEEDVSSLYNGESFYPKKNETLMIEYNSDTVAAMGYMAPWTSPVNKFEVGDNKGINTVVSNDIIQPNQVALWQGILVVDTTAHVLSYLPDKPLLQTLHRKVSPEVMDGYILDAIKEIFNNAQDNELSILAQVGKAISGFTDIKRTVADGAMVLLNKFGIISGYGNGILKPQRSLSRAEFAKIIDKAMGFDTSKPSHPHFKDVSPSDWYYEFVETAYDNGVVHGYPDGTFRPNNIITKTETVTVIDNLLNLYYYGKEKTFVDVYRSFWGYKYIEAAYNKSIIVLQFPIVDPTGPYFKPNNPASRRVASYFVVQAMKYRSLNE